jgi:uncharacterized membrane protein YqjE
MSDNATGAPRAADPGVLGDQPANKPTIKPPGAASMLELLKSIWQEVPGLLSDRVELLSLELERARSALLQILALTVAAGVLGVTSWLLLWAGAIFGLLALGLDILWTLLLVLVVNVVATLWVIARARALFPRLGLPATRRHLTVKPISEQPPSAPSPRHGAEQQPAPAGR